MKNNNCLNKKRLVKPGKNLATYSIPQFLLKIFYCCSCPLCGRFISTAEHSMKKIACWSHALWAEQWIWKFLGTFFCDATFSWRVVYVLLGHYLSRMLGLIGLAPRPSAAGALQRELIQHPRRLCHREHTWAASPLTQHNKDKVTHCEDQFVWGCAHFHLFLRTVLPMIVKIMPGLIRWKVIFGNFRVIVIKQYSKMQATFMLLTTFFLLVIQITLCVLRVLSWKLLELPISTNFHSFNLLINRFV